MIKGRYGQACQDGRRYLDVVCQEVINSCKWPGEAIVPLAVSQSSSWWSSLQDRLLRLLFMPLVSWRLISVVSVSACSIIQMSTCIQCWCYYYMCLLVVPSNSF
uniref:Uncharacterized protein n=1 Tax=Hyaloperonospora arabidopsidis (strain Emoy2) TaxID=559515 RepID=M4BJ06_HYAAE